MTPLSEAAMAQDERDHLDQAAEDRRKFLASCGKFAVVTPPAVTLLLSTSLNSTAVAQSAGHSGNHGEPTSAVEKVIAAIAAMAATALAAARYRPRKPPPTEPH
jgi:hypothetical protein